MSNPATRLHAILQRAHGFNANEPMINGWRFALQLPQELDELAVMGKVGHVFALPEIIARELERFPDLDLELFLGWRNDLVQAFRVVSFQTQFGQFSRQLSTSLLMNLRFCAHELEKRLPEKEIAREHIKELREAVWKLYNEVLKSGLPAHLIRYALDHLFLIIEALDNYEITGAAGVEMALNAVVGAVITENKTAKEFSKSNFGDEFWKLMGKIAVTLELGKFGYELIDSAAKALQ